MPITRRDYFKPIQIGGCVLWLDGADSSTITGTSPVTQWRDKSTSACSVFSSGGSPTYTRTAALSLGCVSFNGSTDYLTIGNFTDLQPNTMFIIATLNSLSTNASYAFIAQSDDSGYPADGLGAAFFYYASGGTPYLMPWAGITGATTNPPLYFSAGATYIYSVLFNGASSGVGYNGNFTSGVNPGTVGWKNLRLGANWPLNAFQSINVAEVIFYSSALSTTQRQQVEAYLAQKWSLTGSLPAGHPGLTSVLYRPVTNTLTKSVYYTQFSPKSIPGASLWLDGADPAGNGVVPANNATVSTWVDKSGSGNNASGGVSPTYNTSERAITFNGSSWLSTSYSSVPANETAFIIFKTTSAAVANNCFMIGPTNIGGRLILSVNENDGFGLSFKIGSYGVANGSRLTMAQNQMYLGTTTVASTTSYVYLNGTQGPSSTITYSGTGTTQIGTAVSGSAIYIGYIYEIVIFNRALSQPERQTIESYLAQKWRLTTALPASHINNTFPAGSPVALQTYIPKVQTNVGYTLFFPGIPTITTPTNTGNITTLTMTWTAPAVTGTAGQVSGYIVYIVASGSPVATQTLGNVLTTSFSPMTTNLNYSYSVAATGPGGTGVTSSSSLTTAYYATPGAPTVGTAANTGNLSTLTMTWTAGSGTTTYYTVYVVVGGSTVATLTPGNVLTTTYSMTTNLEYSFYVTATNTIAGATSESSATTGNAVYYATPGAPTVGTATNTGNSTTLTMTWTAGSGTTTYYTVYIVVGGSTVATLTPGNVLTTTYSMTTNLSYTFYVTGTNTIAGATSGSSATSGSAIYYATPDAPTVNTPTNTLDTLNMSWNAPAQTVTSYTVYVRAASSLVATLTPGLVTSTTYSPMTQSVAYSFYVTATNGTVTSGLSTTSAAVTYTPALVLPSQPYWLAGGTANPNNAVLAFSGNRGINWTNIPLGFTGTVYCVAYNGSNLFVMGGTFSSCLYTSSNGIDWTANGQTLLTGIYSVVYAANISTWVAVGNGASNTIIYSTNGTTWNGAGSIMTTQVLGVAYNGTNLFVAIGYGGSFRLATSVNGISWTGRTTSAFPTYGYGISYSSNGTWLATGTGNPNVAYSTDGTTWTSTVHIASMTNGYGTAFLSNTYLVCGTAGGVFTSANLTSWTQTVPGITAYAISANSNTAICASAGSTTTFSRSENGTTWSSVPLSSASMFTNSVQGLCHVP